MSTQTRTELPAQGTAVMAYSHTSGTRSKWAHRGIVLRPMQGSDEMVLVWFPHLGEPSSTTPITVQAILPHEIDGAPMELADCPPSWLVQTWRLAKRDELGWYELRGLGASRLEDAAKAAVRAARERGVRL